jgi:hypothetical protein
MTQETRVQTAFDDVANAILQLYQHALQLVGAAALLGELAAQCGGFAGAFRHTRLQLL